MQQKVDLNTLCALSFRMKQAYVRLEQQISEMQRDLKALLSQVRSEYSESYVYTAVENAEVNLREVWKSALRIGHYLSKQSDLLNWSVEHYLRTELKNLHIQTSFRPPKQTQIASSTPIFRFTAGEGKADTPIKGYQIYASATMLQRLKQLKVMGKIIKQCGGNMLFLENGSDQILRKENG